MPWDPIKYMGVRLTITGILTFKHDYVRKKMFDTIKQLNKHIYQPQQIHWVVQVQVLCSYCELEVRGKRQICPCVDVCLQDSMEGPCQFARRDIFGGTQTGGLENTKG